MSRTLLEICVDSMESAAAAETGGADRLEVCGPLATGGVSPSLGFVERCLAEFSLTVMMMIRPRDGDFIYSQRDLESMLADIRFGKSLGVHGFVFGALTEQRRVHREHCRHLLEAAGDLPCTFHRAFDVAADPREALEEVIDLGFRRLLTSGQAATAELGAPLIRQLQTQAAGRIAVMPGAGVNASNAAEIVAATGAVELHASASAPADEQTGAIFSAMFGDRRRVTRPELVRAIREALD